ncbi:MAG TPA: flavodoxin-dependent (E)-4-hydroxy-3-methylbut-2-enyl-diphosphate synthase, partial [Clostridia bacterium]|nr:flavodoxin-dependent (E)-4-hydroxy-3-methylbut-2-enyl-diphosphate synthase [Clostridia bacterium]
CDIVRVSVYDRECADALPKIKKEIHIPIVADIHFDHTLALLAVENGADKLRINPGNIPNPEHAGRLARVCKERGIPIRIGVNSGSLSKDILKQYGGVTPEALAESALRHVDILEKNAFEDIVISVKASDVRLMISSYRLLAERVDYPLHLGVTEAGTSRVGIIKSAIGIGTLLEEGIGDTIRVSLTGSPVAEVTAGKDILRSLGLIREGIDIISCPTCGRCRIPLEQVVNEVERALGNVKKPIKIAIMGCVVNGPGEAREADIGLAGGDGCGVIFKKGEMLKKVSEEEMIPELIKEIKAMLDNT